ncbi:hypothetical protein [Acanthopleuribacter pedis]|uniref:Uncharacterized protein n=1 Tax=Acanthopleuribacter pedis TaxID=442870 RepID=A0A8J7U1S5_9BACT|nr:hypothetical protein [Acanthopleuribacter pedis]MBO1317837.1 hypothetical protein [Acanthopleuribacter pedis]
MTKKEPTDETPKNTKPSDETPENAEPSDETAKNPVGFSRNERAVSAAGWTNDFSSKQIGPSATPRRKKTVIRKRHAPPSRDGITLQTIPPEQGMGDLLQRDGLFLLDEVLTRLPLVSFKLKRKVHEHQDAWQRIGVTCRDGVWLVNMRVFRQWYLGQAAVHPRFVERHWDANQLLRQKGCFFLIEVSEKIPFTSGQVRHQARKCADSRTEIGVWKEPSLGFYMVEMTAFARWIREIWLDN